jgi:hypothetical protein
MAVGISHQQRGQGRAVLKSELPFEITSPRCGDVGRRSGRVGPLGCVENYNIA